MLLIKGDSFAFTTYMRLHLERDIIQRRSGVSEDKVESQSSLDSLKTTYYLRGIFRLEIWAGYQHKNSSRSNQHM